MKRVLSFAILALSMTSLSISPAPAAGGVDGDLSQLGYSQEIIKFSQEGVAQARNDFTTDSPMPAPKAQPEPVPAPLSDVDSVQEQLTELGRTRSLSAHQSLKGEDIRDELDSFWLDVQPRPQPAIMMTEAFKQDLQKRMTDALTGAGYTVKQLTLLDMPANLGVPQARAVIRVVRPIKTKNPYREIQNSLAEVKTSCLNAATIEGVLYLGEMTTFLAENPQNNYFYEKTILNP